jgi:hypothetical protein
MFSSKIHTETAIRINLSEGIIIDVMFNNFKS